MTFLFIEQRVSPFPSLPPVFLPLTLSLSPSYSLFPSCFPLSSPSFPASILPLLHRQTRLSPRRLFHPFPLPHPVKQRHPIIVYFHLVLLFPALISGRIFSLQFAHRWRNAEIRQRYLPTFRHVDPSQGAGEWNTTAVPQRFAAPETYFWRILRRYMERIPAAYGTFDGIVCSFLLPFARLYFVKYKLEDVG